MSDQEKFGKDIEEAMKIVERGRQRGKVINYIDYANRISPEQYKRLIEQNLQSQQRQDQPKRTITGKRTLSKKGKILIAGGLATLVLAGAVIANHVNEGRTPSEPIATTSQSEQEKIDTVLEVKQDFIQKYLQEYNRVYGTDYATADLYVKSLEDGAVFEVQDQHITRGNHPDQTRKFLEENIGDVKVVQGYNEVAQIVITTGAKDVILGTYHAGTGEFLYSGNQLEDLQDQKVEKPTLDKLGIPNSRLTSAVAVVLASQREQKPSIDQRIDHYNEVIADKEEPEGFEPGD